MIAKRLLRKRKKIVLRGGMHIAIIATAFLINKRALGPWIAHLSPGT